MKITGIQVKDDGSPLQGPSRGTAGQITVPGILLIETAAQAPIGAAAGIARGGMGASAPIIAFEGFSRAGILVHPLLRNFALVKRA